MTLIELIFFIVMIALGVWSATVLYPIGGLWLAIPGFAFGFLFIPGIWYGHAKYREWAYLGDKDMPDCLCGDAEFRYVKVGEESQLLCQQCRTRYERRRDQTWVYEGNEKKPYKRLVKHEGWV